MQGLDDRGQTVSMNQLITLGITILMALSLSSVEPIPHAEIHPPDNGGPETTQGSGTRWTS